MYKCATAACILVTLLLVCCKDTTNLSPGKVQGYRPVYGQDPERFVVKNAPARNVVKAGKIYSKDQYIFQIEIGEGIHVINNSIPANASRIGFIKIAGSQEISIKGNFLYSNNFGDLVVIDISNLERVVEVKRVKNAFSYAMLLPSPPESGVYFECVDTSKGIVSGWLLDSIAEPKCRN